MMGTPANRKSDEAEIMREIGEKNLRTGMLGFF
jgi:hypothetical protein